MFSQLPKAKVLKLPSQNNFKRIRVISGNDFLEMDYQNYDSIQELKSVFQHVLDYLNTNYEIHSGNSHLVVFINGKETLNIADIIYD